MENKRRNKKSRYAMTLLIVIGIAVQSLFGSLLPVTLEGASTIEVSRPNELACLDERVVKYEFTKKQRKAMDLVVIQDLSASLIAFKPDVVKGLNDTLKMLDPSMDRFQLTTFSGNGTKVHYLPETKTFPGTEAEAQEFTQKFYAPEQIAQQNQNAMGIHDFYYDVTKVYDQSELKEQDRVGQDQPVYKTLPLTTDFQNLNFQTTNIPDDRSDYSPGTNGDVDLFFRPGTPTSGGIKKALDDYKVKVQGEDLSKRDTIFVLLTDGVPNITVNGEMPYLGFSKFRDYTNHIVPAWYEYIDDTLLEYQPGAYGTSATTYNLRANKAVTTQRELTELTLKDVEQELQKIKAANYIVDVGFFNRSTFTQKDDAPMLNKTFYQPVQENGVWNIKRINEPKQYTPDDISHISATQPVSKINGVSNFEFHNLDEQFKLETTVAVEEEGKGDIEIEVEIPDFLDPIKVDNGVTQSQLITGGLFYNDTDISVFNGATPNVSYVPYEEMNSNGDKIYPGGKYKATISNPKIGTYKLNAYFSNALMGGKNGSYYQKNQIDYRYLISELEAKDLSVSTIVKRDNQVIGNNSDLTVKLQADIPNIQKNLQELVTQESLNWATPSSDGGFYYYIDETQGNIGEFYSTIIKKLNSKLIPTTVELSLKDTAGNIINQNDRKFNIIPNSVRVVSQPTQYPGTDLGIPLLDASQNKLVWDIAKGMGGVYAVEFTVRAKKSGAYKIDVVKKDDEVESVSQNVTIDPLKYCRPTTKKEIALADGTKLSDKDLSLLDNTQEIKWFVHSIHEDEVNDWNEIVISDPISPHIDVDLGQLAIRDTTNATSGTEYLSDAISPKIPGFTFDLDVWNKEHKLIFKIPNASTFKNRRLTVIMNAKLKEGLTNEDIAQIKSIKNQAMTNVTYKAPPTDPNDPLFIPIPTNEVAVNIGTNPTKNINGKLEHTVAQETEIFTYNVYAPAKVGMTMLTFSDRLHDSLQFVGTPVIYDMQGNSVTANISIDNNTNTVIGTVEAPALQAGQEYHMQIKAQIKAGLSENEQEILRSVGVENEAKISFDTVDAMTNKVKVYAPQPITKLVENKLEHVLSQVSDEFTYTVKGQSKDTTQQIVFNDTLNDQLDVVGQPVIKNDDNQVVANAQVNGQHISATLNATDIAPNTTYTLEIKARLKSGLTMDQLQMLRQSGVNNNATIAIDGTLLQSNNVKVYAPQTVEKRVENKLEHVASQLTDEFTFTITGTSKEATQQLAFYDQLQDTLEIVGTPVVKNEAQQLIKNAEVNGQIVQATLTSNELSANTSYTLEIKARLKQSLPVDILQQLALSGEVNNATMTLDGTTIASNIVRVYAPQTITKLVEGKQSHILNSITDEFTYTVVGTAKQATEQLELIDTLDDALEVVGIPVIKNDQQQVIKLTQVIGQSVQGILNKDELQPNGTYTLEIKARLKNGLSDQKLQELKDTGVLNNATMKLDGTSVLSNSVTVYTPQTIVKLVEGKQSHILNTMTDEFTYTVQGSSKKATENLLFSDTLDDTLQVVGIPTLKNEAQEIVKNAVVNGQMVSVSLGATEIQPNAIYTLEIKARLKSDLSQTQIEELKQTGVTNDATMTLDGYSVVSNIVKVYGPQDVIKLVENKQEHTLAKVTDEFTYTISGHAKAGIKEITFKDILDDRLEIIGIPVVKDEAQNVVTSAQISGSEVSAVLDESQLVTDMRYTLEIKVRFKAGIADDESMRQDLVDNGIMNKANMSFDGLSISSKSVNVYAPQPIEKKVEGKAEHVLGQLSDEFTYTIKGMSKGATQQLEFSDTLDTVLEVVGQPIVKNEQQQIVKNAQVNGQQISVLLTQDELTANTVYTLEIKARLKSNLDPTVLETLKKSGVINQGTFTLDGTTLISNEVVVYAPQTVEKLIEKRKEHILTQVTDEFTYTITGTSKKGTQQLEFYDKLQDTLDIIGTPEIKDNTQQIIKKAEVVGQEVKATLAANELTANTTYVLEIKARLKPGLDADKMQQLVRLGEINSATMKLDGTSVSSNIVRVYAPQTIEKLVEGKTEHILEKVTDEFTYTISGSAKNMTQSMEFTDTIDSALEIVGTPIVKDLSKNIIVEAKVTGQTVKAILDATVIKPNEVYTLEIKARFKESMTDELLQQYRETGIPNQAELLLDGIPLVSKSVFVYPPLLVTKKIDNKSDHFLERNDEVFTYVISAFSKGNTQEMIFEDHVSEHLQLMPKPILMDSDGNIVGDVTVQQNHVKAIITQPQLKANTEYHLYIPACLNSEQLQEQGQELSQKGIANIAEVRYDNQKLLSEKASVFAVTQPTKTINDIEQLKLQNNQEAFTYNIKGTIRGNVSELIITDVMNEDLEILGVPILTNDKNNVMGTVVVENNVVKASFDTADLVAGMTYNLEVKAKLKATLSEEKINSLVSNGISNQADVSLDGISYITNTVYVTPLKTEKLVITGLSQMREIIGISTMLGAMLLLVIARKWRKAL